MFPAVTVLAIHWLGRIKPRAVEGSIVIETTLVFPPFKQPAEDYRQI